VAISQDRHFQWDPWQGWKPSLGVLLGETQWGSETKMHKTEEIYPTDSREFKESQR
jgi:hypothetical protein